MSDRAARGVRTLQQAPGWSWGTVTVAALVVGLALGVGRVGAQGSPLPPGPNMALVLGACIPCHSAEMVAQQRLDRETWTAIVDRMVSYGAPITPETRPLILDYLARFLGT